MLIEDANAAFLSRSDPARTGEISELMYADDTLILAVNNEDAETYMQCIEQGGRMYGFQLNWNKLEVLPVRCEARIKKPNEDNVVSKGSLLYLDMSCVTRPRSSLHANGEPVLGRRHTCENKLLST